MSSQPRERSVRVEVGGLEGVGGVFGVGLAGEADAGEALGGGEDDAAGGRRMLTTGLPPARASRGARGGGSGARPRRVAADSPKVRGTAGVVATVMVREGR